MKKSGWPTTSRHERGYGSDWDKRRRRILARDCGLCQCAVCKKAGLLTPATEVHHIVSKSEGIRRGWSVERIDDDDNLASINKDCHKRETAAEQGRTLKVKTTPGADGWPVVAAL